MKKNKFSKFVSNNFWSNKKDYPPYGDVIKKRRLHEINFASSYIWNSDKEINSIIDLGCGDGSTTIMLQELNKIKNFYCYDISPGLIETFKNINRSSNIESFVQNFSDNNYSLKTSDLCISFGLFMCLGDEDLNNLVSKIKSDFFISRNPCSLKGREEVNTFSEKIGENYSGIYRTTDEYREIFEKHGFNSIKISRAYPDDIESAFGTKQFFFVCER